MIKNLVSFGCFLLAFFPAKAQTPESFETSYDPHALFSPLFYSSGNTVTRAGNGEPTVAYWQNKADYNINVSLNEHSHEIAGKVIITYKNNSPHTLPFLWLQLDQNFFNKDSRGQARMPLDIRSRYGDSKSNFNGGYTISSVKINNKESEYFVTDTRMQLRLANALKPGGDMVNIQVEYVFTLPEYGADRCGILATSKGDIFTVAQWYPRMCVFDDVEGWNTLPYLGLS